MSKVLIAGFGRVGQAAALALSTLGRFEISGLSRSGTDLPGIATGICADLGKPDTLTALPACDYLVFAAAAGERSEAAYRRTYLEGLRHLLDAQPTPPRRVLFVSSTAVYGQQGGEWVDETSVTRPKGYNGEVMLQAEQLLSGSAWPSTAVRSGGIYGPGRQWLVNRVKQGGAFVQQPSYYTNRIHQQDLGRALAHLIERDRQGQPVADCYLAVDSDPAPEWAVGCFIAEQLGLPVPQVSETSKGQNKRCSNRRLRESGFVFDFPTYREGYRAMLKEG